MHRLEHLRLLFALVLFLFEEVLDLLSLHLLVLAVEHEAYLDLRKVAELSRVHIRIVNNRLELQVLCHFLLIFRVVMRI